MKNLLEQWLCGLSLALVLGILTTSTRLLAVSHIEVDMPLWSFGVVTNVPAVTHDFVLRNTGDTPLKISRVLSSCSACLRASVERMEIPAGGSNAVRCQLDLRLLTGVVSRAVLIDCDDPKTPSVTLGLAGIVIPAYQIVPPEINLDLSIGKQAASAEITPLLALHTNLSQILCGDTNLEATLTPSGPQKYLLDLRVAARPPRGDYSTQLVLRSADTNDPPCLVSVVVRNPPDLELLPPMLKFRPVDDAQTRLLWLKQHGTNALALLDAIPSSDKYHCEIDPSPDGINYLIYVAAWQQQTATSRTNSLCLRLKNASGVETNVFVPMIVEAR